MGTSFAIVANCRFYVNLKTATSRVSIFINLYSRQYITILSMLPKFIKTSLKVNGNET